jgi:hypothetical protein
VPFFDGGFATAGAVVNNGLPGYDTFTVQAAGTYLVQVTLATFSNFNDILVSLVKNSVAVLLTLALPANTQSQVAGSVLAYLAAGDELQLRNDPESHLITLQAASGTTQDTQPVYISFTQLA